MSLLHKSNEQPTKQTFIDEILNKFKNQQRRLTINKCLY